VAFFCSEKNIASTRSGACYHNVDLHCAGRFPGARLQPLPSILSVQGLQLLLIPQESPAPFQSTEIAVNIILIGALYKTEVSIPNKICKLDSAKFIAVKWLAISEDSCGKTKHARPHMIICQRQMVRGGLRVRGK